MRNKCLYLNSANTEKSSHKNKAINPSSEITNNTSNLGAFLPEKETDETMPKWSEANHISSFKNASSPEPKPQLDDSHTDSKQLNS